jgi:hypothetical protein
MKKHQPIIAIVGFFAIFLAAILLSAKFAGQTKPAGGPTVSANKSADGSPAETAKPASEPKASANQKPPQAVFPETVYDAGEVEAGTDVSHIFKVKNTGPGELKIEQVNPG